MKLKVNLSPCALAVLLLALNTAPALGAPRLEMPNDTCRFGFVPMSSVVTYTYWLKSTGSSPLEIEWADGSCPCAALPVSQNVIQPGDSAAFELIFNSGRYAGSVSRRPHIKTNADPEPARPWFDAKVMADYLKSEPLGLKPFRADLSAFGKYRQDTARVRILNNSDDPVIECKMIYERPSYFTVQLPESIPPRGSAEILVIFNPQSPEQAFEKSFTFETTHRVIGDINPVTRMTVPVRRKYGGE